MNNLPGAPRPPDPGEGQAGSPYHVSIQFATRTPLVTWIMIGLCVLVYAIQYISTRTPGSIDLLAALGEKDNFLIIHGQLWRLVTPMFLHGSLLHIGFNMYALLIIGPGLEQHYGHLKFLLLYIVAGMAGNLASFWMSPAPSYGASTAIFGLVAAEAVFVYQNRILFGGRTRSILTNLFIIVAVNLTLGLMPGIDNWGHLGGLMGGLAFSWLGGPLYHLIGMRPDLQLVNGRSSNQTWLVGAVVVIIIGILTFLKIATS
jgi:rhomboid protease GluP